MSLSSRSEMEREIRWKAFQERFKVTVMAIDNVIRAHDPEHAQAKVATLINDLLAGVLNEARVRVSDFGTNNHTYAELTLIIRQINGEF